MAQGSFLRSIPARLKIATIWLNLNYYLLTNQAMQDRKVKIIRYNLFQLPARALTK